MDKFWMVWIAGMKAPKQMHDTYESALAEATRLRTERTGREVHILAPVHTIPGRKLITLRPSAQGCKVEPKEV